ncbi:MAG: restriction endonuclease, partial [Prevotellaceae bacterium]|nr:restriction endonuclease [Prevotellaceae bacterium]
MYSKETLQSVFQSKFDFDTWQNLLHELFKANELREQPELLDVSTETETAYYLGKLSAPDAEIGLFYYRLSVGSVMHKRAGLRKLVKTFINQCWGVFDAALAVFDDGDNWRVSFISDIKGETTSPKRYTFVFGNAAQYYHTAASRFLKLQSDGVSFKTLKEAFSVESLTKEFYKELFDWYQWALSDEMGVTYPNNTSTETGDRTIQEHLIRLITRLMFVWFIKQKKLVPNDIFDVAKLQEILTDFDPVSNSGGNYYNAILQNLFFATLNRPVNERKFATDKNFQGKDEHYGIKTLFRDANEYTYFKKSKEEIIDLFKQSPFLNGGLFECLDKEQDKNGKIFYYDGFSRVKGRQ